MVFLKKDYAFVIQQMQKIKIKIKNQPKILTS
jgi:hypothetical protein